MVRVGTPSAVARPHWYDRNPSNIWRQYAATLGPHSSTQRWSYTVPAGKKALVEFSIACLLRVTAASTVGEAYAYVYYTPSGGTGGSLFEVRLLTNGIGDGKSLIVGQGIMMFAGDQLLGFTGDGSTGGTIEYVIAVKITEFDA